MAGGIFRRGGRSAFTGSRQSLFQPIVWGELRLSDAVSRFPDEKIKAATSPITMSIQF